MQWHWQREAVSLVTQTTCSSSWRLAWKYALPREGGPGLFFVILNHRSPSPPHLGIPQELDGNVVSSSGAGKGWPGPACPGRWPSPALGAVELTEGLVGGGPSWADRARPELIGVSACVRAFPPVGVSRVGSPGTWSGAWSLGSIGVSLSLSGSHQVGTWSNLPCSPLLAAVTVQLVTGLPLAWGSLRCLAQHPARHAMPHSGSTGGMSCVCSPASCLRVSALPLRTVPGNCPKAPSR